MSSVSSQIASGPNGSNKRKLSATSMGPPGGPPEKRVKRPTALEAKLDKLRKTLDGLWDLWEMYDPGYFMTTMRQIRDQVGELTPSTVQEFLTIRVCNELPTTLDALNYEMRTASMGSLPLDLAQTMRNDMIAYVEAVRRCWKGQS